MMSRNVSRDREEQLESLQSFIETTERQLSEIIDTLSWTSESTLNNNECIITCPFDSSHRISEQSLEHHLDACQWKAEGYTKQDIPLPDPIVPSNALSVVKFDKQLINYVLHKAKEQDPSMRIENYECYTWQGLAISFFLTLAIGAGNQLISRTSDRLIADYTGDERKAMYEYVVANTIKPDIGDDIADMNKPTSSQGNDTKGISFLELLAQERNLKRRRTKHRGVHTNKKSHVEILREVINQQMEMYVEYVSDQRDHREPSIEFKSDILSSSDFDNNQQQQQQRSTKKGLDQLKYASRKNVGRFGRDRNGRRSPDFNGKEQSFEATERNAFEFEGEPSTSGYRIGRDRDGRRKHEETGERRKRDREYLKEFTSSEKGREIRETGDQGYRNKHKYRSSREERHHKSRRRSHDNDTSRDGRDRKHNDRRLKVRKRSRDYEPHD